MSAVQKHFDDAHLHFSECLVAFENVQLHRALSNLRSSFQAIEESHESELIMHAKKNITLFVKIFQFEVLANDEIWTKTPKLHALIGDEIHSHHEFENEFRHNVIRQDLGRLLEFTI
jgi:hypothetical protein